MECRKKGRGLNCTSRYRSGPKRRVRGRERSICPEEAKFSPSKKTTNVENQLEQPSQVELEKDAWKRGKARGGRIMKIPPHCAQAKGQL